MRLPRILIPILLATASGCGACDSCFGTKQPGDDDLTAPVPAQPSAKPQAVEDAGEPSETTDDAGKDSSTADSGLVEVPRIAPPPRPSNAPMPLGAFQSCGVYEAPRCERECPKGNCRQECDGVECTLSCNGGYCSQFCGPTGTCRFTCNGGHCIQVCSRADGCIKECGGGDCQ